MSFLQARELREKRANAIANARKLLETAEKENRDLSQEEQQQWDGYHDEAANLKERVDRIERQNGLDEEMRSSQRPPVHVQSSGDVANLQINPDAVRAMSDAEVIPEALHRAFGIEADEESVLRQERQYRIFQRAMPDWIAHGFRNYRPEELRALQAELDISGGYLRPPEQFINELLKNVDDITYIRQLATTFTVVNADSLGVPTLENDPADADWTAELATGSEDSSMSFGKRSLHPHPLAKRIKLSRKLMRAVPNAEALVRMRLAYKFGITYEKAGMTGNGAQQPLGIFVASSDGISTSRDVSTGNTTTSIKVDGLKEAKYTLKMQYRNRARWMFHRDGIKQVAKLKDGEGQYLWAESVRVGEPDRLLDLSVMESEYVPNTFTSGNYVGALGDFSYYWIVDALTLEFQLLNELYAETNQVGLIGRLESDGQPVLEEAFVRVKLA
ncbi:MAG: phage major capsid protein [Anaerolineae bacterium]|nr:phage major capsid protein [Anaerolineae bacterium]